MVERLKKSIVAIERFSRLRQIEIIIELQETLQTVYNDPSLIQHIMYRLSAECLEFLGSGQKLTIVPGQEEQSVMVIYDFIFGH